MTAEAQAGWGLDYIRDAYGFPPVTAGAAEGYALGGQLPAAPDEGSHAASLRDENGLAWTRPVPQRRPVPPPEDEPAG